MADFTFEDFKGITLEQAKANVSFPTYQEGILTDETGTKIRKSAIFRTDCGEQQNERRLLGEISGARKTVPYAQITEWINETLAKTGIEYKILDSVVHGVSNSMEQRYLFDMDLNNPDSYHLSPMLIVKSSYVESPLSLELGTFRFICSNGAVVSTDYYEKKTFTAKKLEDFGSLSVDDHIRRGLDRIVAISNRYQELANEDWKTYLSQLLTSYEVNVEFKKNLVKYLNQTEGSLNILTSATLKNEDFLAAQLKDGVFVANNREILSISEGWEKSAWELYNDTTYLASHQSSSIRIRDRDYRSISNIFAA